MTHSSPDSAKKLCLFCDGPLPCATHGQPALVPARAPSSELLPCPFCGFKAKHIFRDIPLSKWKYVVACGSTTCGAEGSCGADKKEAAEAWNRRSTPAQAANLAEAFEAYRAERFGAYASYPIDAYTYFGAGFKAAEKALAVPQAASDGAPIFAECAEIALEHVGAGPDYGTEQRLGYDEACRDIAAAIRTRASNRKVMDALVENADTDLPTAEDVHGILAPAAPQSVQETTFAAMPIDAPELDDHAKAAIQRVVDWEQRSEAIALSPDARAISDAYSDWAWEKEGQPVGLMLPHESARAGFFAGAKWALALSRPQQD